MEHALLLYHYLCIYINQAIGHEDSRSRKDSQSKGFRGSKSVAQLVVGIFNIEIDLMIKLPNSVNIKLYKIK